MSNIKTVLDNVKKPVQVEKKKEAQPEEIKVESVPQAPIKKQLTEKQREALKKGQETRLRNLEAKREALKNNSDLPTSVKEYEHPPINVKEEPKKAVKKIDDIQLIIKKLDELEKIRKEQIKIEPVKEELTKPPVIEQSQSYEGKQEEKPVEELPKPAVEIESKKTIINDTPWKSRHMVKSITDISQFRINKAVGKNNPFKKL
jgi:hypothetical protein